MVSTQEALAAEGGVGACRAACVPFRTFPGPLATVPVNLPALATRVGSQIPRLFDAQGNELALQPGEPTLDGAQGWRPGTPLVPGAT
jgi:hypothetical protein